MIDVVPVLHAGGHGTLQFGGFFGNPTFGDIANSIACLCMAGVLLFNVLVVGMAYGLYKYMSVVGDDFRYKAMFVGVVAVGIGALLALVNGTIHRPPFSNEYTPALQSATLFLEIVGFALIFESQEAYLRGLATGGS